MIPVDGTGVEEEVVGAAGEAEAHGHHPALAAVQVASAARAVPAGRAVHAVAVAGAAASVRKSHPPLTKAKLAR